MKIVLGTRGSNLALAQTREVQSRLEARFPDVDVEIKVLQTRGDARLDLSLHSNTLSKGLFTEELEAALAAGEIDAAVHSLKDLPVENAQGICSVSVLPRADIRDAWLSPDGRLLSDLKIGEKVGTSSPRRIAQLRLRYPNLEFAPIRGNVETRIRKMEAGEYAGIVMAAAGLHRLGLQGRIIAYFSLEEILPAPGQGAVVVQSLSTRDDLREIFSSINCPATERATTIERTLLSAIGGGCALPLGCYAYTTEDNDSAFSIEAFLGGQTGTYARGRISTFDDNDTQSPPGQAIRTLAERLLAQSTDIFEDECHRSC